MSDTNKAPLRLTSLLRVEERLLEAEHFALRMFESPDSTIAGYELNAFLSAARSVTFLLQKEFAHVGGFESHWRDERAKLGKDKSAAFLLELRNFSQKEGRVSIVGTTDGTRKWRYMFAGTVPPVPPALLNRDVADCCLEHLAKLAQAVLRFAKAFPYHSCPPRALTPSGIAALGLDSAVIEAALGFPPAVSAARPKGSVDDLTRLYRRFVDPVDFEEIERMAGYRPVPPLRPEHDLGLSLGLSMAEKIEGSRVTGMSHDTAVRFALVSEVLKAKPSS